MIMYVFQADDSFDYVPSEKGVVLLAGKTLSVVNLVAFIGSMAPPGPSIECLHLCSHGNAGWVVLGQGVSLVNAWEFRNLRGRFQEGGRGIRIHGCMVAAYEQHHTCEEDPLPTKKTIGRTFMQRLANAAQATVTAAYTCQLTDQYVGAILSVTPETPDQPCYP
jgi:hypothetical protein